MLREHELLVQELHSTADHPQGALQLGVVPTAVPMAARFAAMLQARHPGIAPVVRSLSSQEIESGLDDLSLDLGLGFIERIKTADTHFAALPQYSERYFLVRRASRARKALHIGVAMSWRDAARLPLCLLTRDMHNRSIVDAAFAEVNVKVKAVMETNSILTLAISVQAGDMCSVLPGSLVGAVRSQGELEALPLVRPEVTTPVGFITLAAARPSRTLQAALVLAHDPQWLRHAAAHSGLLKA
jgi:DNA-binding transcriptional LysR family regulator